MSDSTLPQEIRNLPIAARMTLVEQIWDSIVEDEAEIEFTPAQRAELDRRLALREADPGRGVAWEDVKRRLLDSP